MRNLEQVFLPLWNERFRYPPQLAGDAYRVVPKGMNLDSVFSIRVIRTVSADYRVRWEGESYRIEREQITAGMRGSRVQAELRRDGSHWSSTRRLNAARIWRSECFLNPNLPFLACFCSRHVALDYPIDFSNLSRGMSGVSSSNRSASKMCLRTISVRVLNFCDVSLSDCCYSATTTRRRLERAAMRNCQATAGHLRISAMRGRRLGSLAIQCDSCPRRKKATANSASSYC